MINNTQEDLIGRSLEQPFFSPFEEEENTRNQQNYENNIVEDYTDMQKMYEKVVIEENEPLVDGIEYISVLKNVNVSETYTAKTPTIDFIYEVYAGTTPKIAVDTFVFDISNKQYLEKEIKRLKDVLCKYSLELSVNEFKNVNTIALACQCLVGLKAKIQQYSKNGYSKYDVIVTEKKSSI